MCLFIFSSRPRGLADAARGAEQRHLVCLARVHHNLHTVTDMACLSQGQPRDCTQLQVWPDRLLGVVDGGQSPIVSGSGQLFTSALRPFWPVLLCANMHLVAAALWNFGDQDGNTVEAIGAAAEPHVAIHIRGSTRAGDTVETNLFTRFAA